MLASTAISRLKNEKSALDRRYSLSDNGKALTQVLATLVSIALLWQLALMSLHISLWLAVGSVFLLSLFLVRAFALMHECGHKSLFRTQWLNRTFGFILGVVAGMPQYVWSQNHNYHHSNNGNWERYRGLYTTLSVDEYAAMSSASQRIYRCKCSIAIAPFAGLLYVILNPRFTWLKGSVQLLRHLVERKAAQPAVSIKVHAASFKTRYWRSYEEYWHMSANNVVLLTVWVLMSCTFGAVQFFTVYLISASLAAGAGIVLFTVQHNFEHSYASDTTNWDYDVGAIEGTSFLILPSWLNWFTANIAYHHIHHLSARIPNYCLIECHKEYQHLFVNVTRVRLSKVPRALKYILWDRRTQRIISIAEYQRQIGQVT